MASLNPTKRIFPKLNEDSDDSWNVLHHGRHLVNCAGALTLN